MRYLCAASVLFVIAGFLGLLAVGTTRVWAKASPACRAGCVAAANDCVALRQQERDVALAACTGTGRRLSRCKRQSKAQFAKGKRLCKGKARNTCQRCCTQGDSADECVVVPNPPASTTTTTPGAASTTTTLPSGQFECPVGVFRVPVVTKAVGDALGFVSTFELPAACRDDVALTLAPTHIIRLRRIGPNGQPLPSPGSLSAAEAILDPLPTHPQGVTVASGGVADADGRVQFRVTDGHYRVQLGLDCSEMVAPRQISDVTVAGADIDLGDVMLDAQPMLRVHGTVSNADVASGADVRVSAASTVPQGPCASPELDIAPRPDGTLDYDLLMPAGPIVLRVVQRVDGPPCAANPALIPKHGLSAYKMMQITGDTRADVALVPSVAVRGTLLAPDASPAVGSFVNPIGYRDPAPAMTFSSDSFQGCPADATGRFVEHVVPDFTYTLLGVSVQLFTGGPTYPPQILLAGLRVGQTVDVGTVTLRDGCRLRGQVNGLPATPVFTGISVCESRTLPDGHCLPVCSSALADLNGRFDLQVLPGL